MANIFDASNRFSQLPSDVVGEASSFDRSFNKLTTMNSGKLYPILVDELLPGDRVSMDLAFVARMATPLVPVMDDCFADIFFFSVPNRLLWDSWKQFFGEAEPSAWDEPIEKVIPHGVEQFKSNGVGDNFGLPTLVPIDVSVLPFRAYQLIWNEWFRDQNLQDSLLIQRGDNGAADFVVANGYSIDDLLPVNKVHDYFTSSLPRPQKGDAVTIALGNLAPVVPSMNESIWRTTDSKERLVSDFYDSNGELANAVSGWSGSNAQLRATTYTGAEGANGVYQYSNYQDSNAAGPTLLQSAPRNLFADLSNASAVTINDLRNAVMMQHFLEADARGGTRYRSYILNHFGVTVPDSTVQVPEYLGGKRIPITMSQVVQTSSSVGGDSPQALGDTGAFSKTVDVGHYFDYTATEHCYLIGVACIRYKHSYQQGINRLWSRRDRFEFYDPIFAHKGEQPVFNREIYVVSDSGLDAAKNDEVFGYQEAWAEYRYRPNEVCGDFRSNAPNGSLDFWHYGDDYESQPYLSADWIKENPRNIDRTLAVASQSGNGEEITNQFLVSMAFRPTFIRQMPVYSIPGLETL